MYTKMLIIALFIKWPKLETIYMFINNNLWYIHIIKYCKVMKKNKLYHTRSTNSAIIILMGMWATQEYPLYDLIYTKARFGKTRLGDRWCSLALRLLFRCYWSQWCKRELIGCWKFYILIRVVILYVEIKWCVHLRSVHFTVCVIPHFN